MYRGIVLIFCLLCCVAPAIAAPPDTVMTGIVFAYGHELRPPYVLEIRGNTLCINRVQVYPDLSQSIKEPTSPSAETVAWTDEAMPVYRKAWDLEKRLRDAHAGTQEVTAQVAASVREDSAVVDSVTDVSATGFVVHWKDGSEEYFSCLGGGVQRSAEEQLQRELSSWRRSLGRNSIIVTGSGGCVCPRSEEARLFAEIERARSATAQQLEDWRSPFFSATIADQFRAPWPIEENK